MIIMYPDPKTLFESFNFYDYLIVLMLLPFGINMFYPNWRNNDYIVNVLVNVIRKVTRGNKDSGDEFKYCTYIYLVVYGVIIIVLDKSNGLLHQWSTNIAVYILLISALTLAANKTIGRLFTMYKNEFPIKYENIKDTDEYASIILDHIIRKKNNISIINQTYVNNNVITDVNDFLSSDITARKHKLKSKLYLGELDIQITRYLMLTKPTDIYFISKLLLSDTISCNKLMIYLLGAKYREQYLPYPNYTLIKYKNNDTITVETYPHRKYTSKIITDERNTYGIITSNKEYYRISYDKIETMYNAIREKATLDKVESYKLDMYLQNKMLYYWSIGYIISKVLEDKFGEDNISVYAVGSYAKQYIKYEQKVRKEHINYSEPKINDLDIMIYIKESSYEIKNEMYEEIIEAIESITGIYSVKQNGRQEVIFKPYYTHNPIVEDMYYKAEMDDNEKEEATVVPIHILIVTEETYKDAAIMVRYHREAWNIPFGQKSDFPATVKEYNIREYYTGDMGLQQMKSMILKEETKIATWERQGVKRVYQSKTRSTPLAEEGSKESDNLTIRIRTETEKCRLYKYVLKWSTINLAYAKDYSSVMGFTIKHDYSKEITYSKELVEHVLRQIEKKAESYDKNKINRAVENVIEFYKKPCKKYPSAHIEETRRSIIKIIEVIEKIITKKR